MALVATTVPSILLLLLDRDDEDPRARWEPIATRSALAERDVIYDPRWGVFLVDEPQAPLAFYAMSPDNPTGGERVLFCPSSGWFEAMAHGEQFDRRGVWATGPGTRGLDRFDVRIDGDVIEVDVQVVYTGLARGSSRPDPARGPSCGDRGWTEADPGFWGAPPGFDGPI